MADQVNAIETPIEPSAPAPARAPWQRRAPIPRPIEVRGPCQLTAFENAQVTVYGACEIHAFDNVSITVVPVEAGGG